MQEKIIYSPSVTNVGHVGLTLVYIVLKPLALHSWTCALCTLFPGRILSMQ